MEKSPKTARQEEPTEPDQEPIENVDNKGIVPWYRQKPIGLSHNVAPFAIIVEFQLLYTISPLFYQRAQKSSFGKHLDYSISDKVCAVIY